MSLLNSLSASNRGHKRCVAHKTRMVSDCDQGTMLKNRLMNHHRQQIWPEQRDASNQEVNATNISWRWPTQPRRKCRLAIRKCPRLNKHLESILYNLPFLEQMAIHTKNLKTSWRNRAYQNITRHNKDTKDTKNMYHWFGTFLSKSVSRVSLAIPPKLLHHDRRTKKELAKEFDPCYWQVMMPGWKSHTYLLWALHGFFTLETDSDDSENPSSLGSEMISFLTLFAITRNFVHALKLQSMIFHL